MPTFSPPTQPIWGPSDQVDMSTYDAPTWFKSACSGLPSDDSFHILARLAHPETTAGLTSNHMSVITSKLLTATDPMMAWGAHNVALQVGVKLGCIALVQTALCNWRWRACESVKARIVGWLVRGEVSEGHSEAVLECLLDDARFGQSVVHLIAERVSEMTSLDGPRPFLVDRACRIVDMALTHPKAHPGILWEHVMIHGMCKADVPLVLVRTSLVSGEWQWIRATRRRGPQVGAEFPSAGLQQHYSESSRYPQLLVDLPADLQLRLHDFLDSQSAARLRSTCRSLSTFPMDRFAQQRLEYELCKRSPDAGYKYDCAHIRSLVDAIPLHCGDAALGGRVLVEAIRHLDADLALDVMTDVFGPELVYVFSWALYTLLNPKAPYSSEQVAAVGQLLVQLLAHPSLPESAWCLVLFAYPTAVLLLTSTPLPPVDKRADQAPFLMHLAASRVLQPTIPSRVLDHFRDDTSAVTHAALALAILSGNPHTFQQLFGLLPSPLITPLYNLILDYLVNLFDRIQHDPATMLHAVLNQLGQGGQVFIADHLMTVATRGHDALVSLLLPYLDPEYSRIQLCINILSNRNKSASVRSLAIIYCHWIDEFAQQQLNEEARVDGEAYGTKVFELGWFAARHMEASVGKEEELEERTREQLSQLRAKWEPYRGAYEAEVARRKAKERCEIG